MKANRMMLLIVFCLLVSGWVMFQILQPGATMQPDEPGFRIWFWDQRALDLAVQVALIFAGALGIAAILPEEDEDG